MARRNHPPACADVQGPRLKRPPTLQNTPFDAGTPANRQLPQFGVLRADSRALSAARLRPFGRVNVGGTMGGEIVDAEPDVALSDVRTVLPYTRPLQRGGHASASDRGAGLPTPCPL